jgi:RNA-binding protein
MESENTVSGTALKREAKQLKPIVRIGKNGITPAQVEEIHRHLKKRGIIKVKLLNNFLSKTERKEAAKSLGEKTGSRVVAVTGFTVVLFRGKAAMEENEG